MVYKFNIRCKKEESNFLRTIEISENDNFFSFYKIIHKCAEYDESEMTSFFISNDEWERFEEITLIDMGVKSDNIFVMKDIALNKFINKVGDKLVYLFDFFSERYFKIELIEIIDKELNPNRPACIAIKGDSPKQIMINDKLDTDIDLDKDAGFNDDSEDDDIKFENIDDIDNI